MPNTFEDDSMGLSFVHNLCISNDEQFIDYLLDQYKNNTEAFRKITGIQDMNSEMNRRNEMSKLTPILAVFGNGKYEIVKAVCEHIVKKETIKVDVNQKDSRARNILHLIIYNKNLSDKDTLDIFENYLLKFNESMFYSAH